VGYFLAVAINLALLFFLNVAPGWEVFGFLTADTAQIMPIMNASLVAGALANLVFVITDPPAVKALGDLITTAITFAVALRVWQVYPFDFTGYSFDWDIVVRFALVVAMFGTAVGAVVALVRLLRLGVTRSGG
jgi:hypothetical protein